jgi:hypothetical protein
MMNTLRFTLPGNWTDGDGFGCASLGLAGTTEDTAVFSHTLDGLVLYGQYAHVLRQVEELTDPDSIQAAIVLFGNAGGENEFLRKLRHLLHCPMVGGGAAIDSVTGKSALLTGGSPVAIFLIKDARYRFETETLCIHEQILEDCTLTLADPRTILTINGVDGAAYLAEKKNALGLRDTDFEHLTLTDLYSVNAHLSKPGEQIKSGRDLQEKMQLRYIPHEKVYDRIRAFYNDPDAIVFGCAGLGGILDHPLDTPSLGLLLFGEVCTVGDHAEFGNLMLSKLRILSK